MPNPAKTVSSLFVILATIWGAQACASENSVEIKEGQAWSIKSESYSNAKVLIQKIALENVEKPAIHITVVGPFTLANDKIVPLLSHVPLSEAALRKSIVAPIEVEQTHDESFAEGFHIWSETEEAGVYSITVDEILHIGFEIMQDDRNVVSGVE